MSSEIEELRGRLEKVERVYRQMQDNMISYYSQQNVDENIEDEYKSGKRQINE